MDGFIAPAAFVFALFLFASVCVARPRLLLWPDGSFLAAGLSGRVRASVTRAAGFVILLLSLWLAWRFFIAAG